MILSLWTRTRLRKICRKLVIQGPLHQRRITEYFRVMVLAARDEFREDTKPCLDAFLRECLEDALKLPTED